MVIKGFDQLYEVFLLFSDPVLICLLQLIDQLQYFSALKVLEVYRRDVFNAPDGMHVILFL